MNRASLTSALDLALGFGAAAGFVLIYGVALGAVWPQVFGAEWPFLGADAAGALLRARVVDAVLGVGFGGFLAIAARRGWVRKPHAAPLMLAAGVLLYAALDAYGSRNVVSAVLETPLPWVIGALVVVGWALGREARRTRNEV